MSHVKSKIYKHCLELCDERIALAQGEVEALLLALREETKSSAGDKYETTRAMINLEKEKIEENLLGLMKKRLMISAIDPSKVTTKIKNGSLVTTEAGVFFISTSLGKLEIDGNPIFVISPVSPIAQVMLDLTSGDSFEFNGKKNSVASLS